MARPQDESVKRDWNNTHGVVGADSNGVYNWVSGSLGESDARDFRYEKAAKTD